MTESQAVAIGMKYIAEQGLRHEGVSHAVFVPRDDPFHPASHDNEIWYIYFKLPSTPDLERFDFDTIVLEVDCLTGKATLKPNM